MLLISAGDSYRLEKTMSHVYRWHPRLTAGVGGPMVGKFLLHLQQSDLDGACGQHSALMALMLLF